MPCPDGDFYVTPWRPSFPRMETNESPLVGRSKVSGRGRYTWCKHPEQLIFFIFCQQKVIPFELSYFIRRSHATSRGMFCHHSWQSENPYLAMDKGYARPKPESLI